MVSVLFLFKSKLSFFLSYFTELGYDIHWPVSAKKVNFKAPQKAIIYLNQEPYNSNKVDSNKETETSKKVRLQAPVLAMTRPY